MRQLSTPCLLGDHRHCAGEVIDLYGDEHYCACPCHNGEQLAADPDQPPHLRLQSHALRLLILLALATAAYLLLCLITAGIANAAAHLLVR